MTFEPWPEAIHLDGFRPQVRAETTAFRERLLALLPLRGRHVRLAPGQPESFGGRTFPLNLQRSVLSWGYRNALETSEGDARVAVFDFFAIEDRKRYPAFEVSVQGVSSLDLHLPAVTIIPHHRFSRFLARFQGQTTDRVDFPAFEEFATLYHVHTEYQSKQAVRLVITSTIADFFIKNPGRHVEFCGTTIVCYALCSDIEKADAGRRTIGTRVRETARSAAGWPTGVSTLRDP